MIETPVTEWRAERFRALRDAGTPRRFAGLIGPVRRVIWLALRPWLFHLAHAQDGLAARIAVLERDAAAERAAHEARLAAATAEATALQQALAAAQRELALLREDATATQANAAAERARRDFDQSTTRAELLAIGHVVSLCREQIAPAAEPPADRT